MALTDVVKGVEYPVCRDKTRSQEDNRHFLKTMQAR